VNGRNGITDKKRELKYNHGAMESDVFDEFGDGDDATGCEKPPT